MLELLIELVLNALKVFVLYISVPVIGLPVGMMVAIVIVIALPAIILFVVFTIGTVWLCYKLFRLAWRGGWTIIQRFCWLIWKWLDWAVSYRRWVVPPLTLLTWWLPGAVFVPLVGGLFITLFDANIFFGALIGTLFYIQTICVVLLIGYHYENKYRNEAWENLPRRVV